MSIPVAGRCVNCGEMAELDCDELCSLCSGTFEEDVQELVEDVTDEDSPEDEIISRDE